MLPTPTPVTTPFSSTVATSSSADEYVTCPARLFHGAQVKLDNKVLYFAGAMDGYYLATTEDATAAVDVYFEDAGEGAIRLYFILPRGIPLLCLQR